VCDPGQWSGPAAALAAVTAGLTALAGADLTGLTTGEQADLLRALGVAEARVVAARSAVLAAFGATRGYESDGAGSARSWLRWQTRITPQAAAAAAGWARRLAAHPDVAAALAAGAVSPSWARCICDWTSRLPVFGQQQDADKVLLAAAAGGAELADLAGLAEEITRRCAGPDSDRDGEGDGFRDRHLQLAGYWQGSGLLQGNLTPECAAALRAVLDSLNGTAGAEDHRTAGQRDHDALCEALTRLLAARCPARAGRAARPGPAAHDPGPAAGPARRPRRGRGVGRVRRHRPARHRLRRHDRARRHRPPRPRPARPARRRPPGTRHPRQRDRSRPGPAR
jgi:hypothetical protein